MRSASGGRRVLLRQLREVMAEPVSAQDRLNKIVVLIAANMVAEVCSLYVLRVDGMLELYATEGLKAESVHVTVLRQDEGLVGLVASEAKSLNLSDAQHHPAFAFRPETGEEIYHSFLGVPILRAGNTLGVLVVQNRAQRTYSEDEEEALQTTAMVLGETIASGELSSMASHALKEPKIPDQSPGLRFTATTKGLIDLEAPRALSPDELTKLASQQKNIRKVVDELSEVFRHSSNSHKQLQIALGEYTIEINRKIIDLDFRVLWQLGIRLQNDYSAAIEAISHGEEPSFSPHQRSLLTSLLAFHGPFVLSSADGVDIIALVERYNRTIKEDVEVRNLGLDLLRRLSNNAPIATARALHVTQVAVEDIARKDDLSKGGYSGRAALANFLTVGATAVIGVATGVAANAISTSASGQQLLQITGAEFDRLVLFFSANESVLRGLCAYMTDSLSWMEHFLNWLENHDAGTQDRKRERH